MEHGREVERENSPIGFIPVEAHGDHMEVVDGTENHTGSELPALSLRKIEVHESSYFEEMYERHTQLNADEYAIIELPGRFTFVDKKNIRVVGGAKKQVAKGVAQNVVRAIVREQLASIVGKTNAKAAISTVSRAARGGKAKKKKPKRAVRSMTFAPNQLRSFSDGRTLVLGKAANDWVNAYLHPFDLRIKSVGVPRPGSQPSFKTTGFIRGTGYIGEDGLGFVYGMPCLCNDRACLGVTTADFTQGRMVQFSNNVGVISQNGTHFSPKPGFMSNLPFNANQLQGTGPETLIEGRIVAASLRAYYTGTALNKSGSYYAYVDPDFANIIGAPHDDASMGSGYSVDMLATKDATEISSIQSSREARIVWCPPSANLFDYAGPGASNLRKTYPYAENVAQFDGATATSCAAICLTGVAGETFYYEMIVHAEYAGPGVYQALLTESVSDVVGFDTVCCAMQRAQRKTANDVHCNLDKCIRSELAAESIKFKEY